MIKTFEQHTEDLNAQELGMVPMLVDVLSKRVGKKNAVSSEEIQRFLAIQPRRLRKIVNHIRNRSLIEGLLASGKGYYISTDRQEIEDYIESLEGRESAIRTVREGMEAYLRRLDNKV